MTSATALQSRKERHPVSPDSSGGEWVSVPGYTEPTADSDWRRIVGALDARIADLEARIDRATAELESGALARLQRSFGKAIRQAQERMKRYAEACGHSRLVELDAVLDRRLEPFLNRSQAAIQDLERLLETLRQEQAAWEMRIAQQDQRADDRPIQDLVALRLQRLSESLQDGGRCTTGPDGAADTALAG